jgi:hypothetical protein
MSCPDASERLTWVEICVRYPDEWVLLAEIEEEIELSEPLASSTTTSR